jgi:CRISPR-associated protein (TIGR02584 family)
MPKPRRILVCVTGLSPQIVTETLYALAVKQGWVPDHICLITTAEGAKRVRLSLLSEDPGWFARLLKDYQLPPIRFGLDDIRVLTDAQGNELSDIRTPQDNERAADFIVTTLRELSADPDSQLHVSIAGGRKTMGFYLGYALSLFGRPQDRLSHVLVSEPFESSWNFFYPTPYSKVIELNDKTLADTQDAEITLASIPFVSLRHGMPDQLMQGAVGFAGAVAAINRSLAPPELIIDLEAKRIRAAGEIIPLPPVELALLSVFARRALTGQPACAAPSKDVPDSTWAAWFMLEYDQIRPERGDEDATRRSLAKGMDGDYFSLHKSRLHANLKKRLGPAAEAYLINNGRRRPYRYSLGLPPSSISYRKLAVADTQAVS